MTLSPLTNLEQGVYTAYIKGYLTSYTFITANSQNFTITVGYCVVTSLTLSIATASNTYTLTNTQ